jgi:hypothetical protein
MDSLWSIPRERARETNLRPILMSGVGTEMDSPVQELLPV